MALALFNPGVVSSAVDAIGTGVVSGAAQHFGRHATKFAEAAGRQVGDRLVRELSSVPRGLGKRMRNVDIRKYLPKRPKLTRSKPTRRPALPLSGITYRPSIPRLPRRTTRFRRFRPRFNRRYRRR